MRPSSLHYFPLEWPFLVALFVLFLIVVALIGLDILRYAYERMGIPSRYVLMILLLSLVGSAINIPVAQFPPEKVVSGAVVEFDGTRYVVPAVHDWPGTVLATNVGGALIPVILSIYLLIRNNLYLRAMPAIAVVAVAAHLMARPLHGVGISLPIFIPPIVAAVAAMLFGWRQGAPLAYIAGSLGTLIGADLLNPAKVQGLGAPVVFQDGYGCTATRLSLAARDRPGWPRKAFALIGLPDFIAILQLGTRSANCSARCIRHCVLFT